MVTNKSWIELSSPVRSEVEQGVYSAVYTLADLAQRGGISAKDWEQFQQTTHLADFYWRTYWRRGDVVSAGGRGKFPSKVDAVVVFMHGWDGCGEIWENLPARVVGAGANIMALVPDVNGFNRSPFQEPENIGYEDCSPAGDMRAIENWLQVLRVVGGRRHTPVILVGHSMSGAALFYLNDKFWSNHAVGRVAIAPALLMNDIMRKGFYRTLGLGIFATQKLALEQLSNTLSPVVVNQLISGASKGVQAAHERVFKNTSKATLSNTFYAMGKAARPIHNKHWENFKVLLGHEDRLVGLTPMLSLLVDLGLGSRQIRVVLGDHYFFSVGHHSHALHQESREVAFEEISEMVQKIAR